MLFALVCTHQQLRSSDVEQIFGVCFSFFLLDGLFVCCLFVFVSFFYKNLVLTSETQQKKKQEKQGDFLR